jgi:hypothetical protein
MKALVVVQVFLMSSFMYHTRHSFYFNPSTCILQPFLTGVNVLDVLLDANRVNRIKIHQPWLIVSLFLQQFIFPDDFSYCWMSLEYDRQMFQSRRRG